MPAISVSPCQTFSGSALKHEITVFISFVDFDVDSAQILFCADADLAAEVVVTAYQQAGEPYTPHILHIKAKKKGTLSDAPSHLTRTDWCSWKNAGR